MLFRSEGKSVTVNPKATSGGAAHNAEAETRNGKGRSISRRAGEAVRKSNGAKANGQRASRTNRDNAQSLGRGRPNPLRIDPSRTIPLRRRISDAVDVGDKALQRSVLKEAYLQGRGNAYDQSQLRRGRIFLQDGQITAGGIQENNRRLFVSNAKKELSYIPPESFGDLKGISKRRGKVLDGIVQADIESGKPRQTIVDRIYKGLGFLDDESRAKVIAQTEVTRRYADGQLDAIEEMGYEGVKLIAEWSTTDNPCELCAPLDGIRMTIAQARGLLPRHVGDRRAHV